MGVGCEAAAGSEAASVAVGTATATGWLLSAAERAVAFPDTFSAWTVPGSALVLIGMIAGGVPIGRIGASPAIGVGRPSSTGNGGRGSSTGAAGVAGTAAVVASTLGVV